MTEHIWNTISEIITGRLYLTGLKGVENIQLIRELKIDIIVSVTDFVPFRYKKPKQYSNIEFVHYYAEDKEDFCLTQYFNKFVELMNNNPNKKILVHCLVGMSRSATIVGSYILYKKIVIEHNNNYRVEQMIKDLKECREWVDPNNGFIKQLEEFRDKLVCG